MGLGLGQVSLNLGSATEPLLGRRWASCGTFLTSGAHLLQELNGTIYGVLEKLGSIA